MAILNFGTTNDSNSTTRNSTPFGGATNFSDQPKAKLWLNIGYVKGDKFINLPLGMPIDTMKPAEVRGQNEDWIKQQNARNALLKALQEAGAGFEPGQEQDINLVIRMRRVNEEVEVAAADNEYTVDLHELLAIPQAAE